MAWTYNIETLAATPKDQVRLLIGDTLQKDPQLQDEEIAFLLTLRTSIWGAAAECCRMLASQMSRQADSVQGELRTLYSSRSKAYAARADGFEAKAALGGAALPYAGGISLSDKQTQESNTDRVPPQFAIGMEDNFLPVGAVGNETESNADATTV